MFCWSKEIKKCLWSPLSPLLGYSLAISSHHLSSKVWWREHHDLYLRGWTLAILLRFIKISLRIISGWLSVSRSLVEALWRSRTVSLGIKAISQQIWTTQRSITVRPHREMEYSTGSCSHQASGRYVWFETVVQIWMATFRSGCRADLILRFQKCLLQVIAAKGSSVSY